MNAYKELSGSLLSTVCHEWMSVMLKQGVKIKPLGPSSPNKVFEEWILFIWFPFFLAEANGMEKIIQSGCDPKLWLLSNQLLSSVFAFLLAMMKRWVVLICRPHAVMLSWHSGFDKPLLSAVCLQWQEVSKSTARRQSSWMATVRLQGLASVCYTELYAAFMWLRLRGSGFANLIYSPRLAAAS